MAMLEVNNINVFYGSIHAVKDISFQVNKGEIISLIGANGAGKTTILQTVSGLLKSTTGSIVFNNQDLMHIPAHKIVSQGCICPRELPVCVCGRTPAATLITKKPAVATAEELADNPRSRSAKLRCVEKVHERYTD